MVVQIKKLLDKYFITNLIITIFVFSFGVFINRGLSIEPVSLGVYFDELSMMLPEVSNHRFPQRILLPLISYLTGINVQILNIFILFVFIFSIFNYILTKQSRTISFFVTLMVATTMVFQFHIIYGGYPDALSLLLYFLAIKLKPNVIVETGVAAGWSSLAFLRALRKNGKGKLYSSDFPYFRLDNPEQYIGYLAKNEINKINWFLDIRGDDLAIPEILKRLGENNIDLFHYDSDKSYSGRDKVLKNLNSKINSKTIVIFDDIQDNLHFKNLTEKMKKEYCIIEFNGKYLGIIGVNFLMSNRYEY